MKELRESIERRSFALRHDERFEDLLTEQIRKAPSLNKLVLTGKLETEDVREFALRAIEVGWLREHDSQMELPHSRFEEQVDRVLKKVGYVVEAEHEQREAVRAWFRFMFATINVGRTKGEAYRAFALVTPRIIDALGRIMNELLPLLLSDESDTTDTHHRRER